VPHDAAIAVLDDEARMTEVLAMLLRREAHEVTCFTDPQACVAALGERGFDLLFTDLKMPGMDGLAVLTGRAAAGAGHAGGADDGARERGDGAGGGARGRVRLRREAV
jgi:CheY-like chemotaxis protein